MKIIRSLQWQTDLFARESPKRKQKKSLLGDPDPQWFAGYWCKMPHFPLEIPTGCSQVIPEAGPVSISRKGAPNLKPDRKVGFLFS
jgi:hypothetical protein